MSSYDLRLDIPARAKINFEILTLIEDHELSLQEAKKQLFLRTEPYCKTFTEADVNRYRCRDHSLAISMLFCMIVIPKELLLLPRDHKIYKDLDNENIMMGFRITQPAEKIGSSEFIRLLRNSVSHANFSVRDGVEDAEFEFWTEREPIFRATISYLGLMDFLGHVGSRLANAALERK